MKCKPNQLVRYVGKNPFNRPNVYGWIGHTIEQKIDSFGVPCWIVDPPLPGGDVLSDNGSKITPGNLVWDTSLQPIENPGEDAIDQMVLSVGKPATEDNLLTV